ncbi:penicillin-binding protein 1B [Porticoccus sp. W117]|uniref:penicillin-binding protein 1B n=1 Tax=Porticoccus sp. W117 TaxID=3054777 RepID=UPI00259133F8|nr:penicillin-binding protein 1B [Porticoccus sp. W117]MDM3870492.1 penicillin-binding protein 1B [Porticoccus sp. W117]
MARRKNTIRSKKFRGKSAQRKRGFWGAFWRLAWKGALWFLVLLIPVTLVLDFMVRAKFEGSKWALPAHVYSRALDLYEGLQLDATELVWELDKLGYRASATLSAPGQYRRSGNRVEFYSRGFRFWDSDEPAQRLQVRFDGDQVSGLRASGESAAVARLEPLRIGGIFPEHLEDRELVRLEALPPYLIDGLLAVEDQNFEQHYGVSPRGIARAFLANVKAGELTQGGSTITQQLVKNFYLTSERSLWRKLVEIPMALLLELHYDKAEILEAYINEVYLGQAGKRAIHGFGLASRHYFRQPVGELDLHQVALLVALVKGASYYDPWRRPERALKRRNLVLDVMASHQLIDKTTARQAKAKGLGVVAKRGTAFNDYPAYLDLVKRQLRRDYSGDDLRREGLRIFTNFDPQAQRQLEKSITNRLKNLEQGYRVDKGQLQAGAVVARVGSGEVLAVAGSRQPRYAGFNRALDAQRPVGSTIKPAVYLTALQQGYNLATLIPDREFEITTDDGTLWRPRNFNRESHGDVPLYQALGHSYNLATAQLGLELGVPAVANTVERLGLERSVPQVPAMLLGASAMSPMEVAGIYHTIAADGFYTPLRAIRAIYSADNQPLRRYPYQVEQRFSADNVHLLQYAMQVVVREGTGRGVYRQLPSQLAVAGKTGTSNGQRDSWFAGFTGNYLSVVWLGRDDNGKMPLTGATGALRVWGDIMKGMDNQSLDFQKPQRVSYLWVDPQGRLSGERCRDARYLPFTEGTEPREKGPCYDSGRSVVDWFRKLFD